MPTRTLAALIDTLGHGMTPQRAIASPSLGGFDYSKAAAGVIGIRRGGKVWAVGALYCPYCADEVEDQIVSPCGPSAVGFTVLRWAPQARAHAEADSGLL